MNHTESVRWSQVSVIILCADFRQARLQKASTSINDIANRRGFKYLLWTLHLNTCFSSAAATFAMIGAVAAGMNAQRVSRASMMPNLIITIVYDSIIKRCQIECISFIALCPCGPILAWSQSAPKYLTRENWNLAQLKLLRPRSSTFRNAQKGECDIRLFWLTRAMIKWLW